MRTILAKTVHERECTVPFFGRRARPLFLTGTTTAEEFELVFKVGKPAFLGDLLLEVLDWTGDIEHLDGTAVAANEVILMMGFTKAVMGRAAVKTDATNDAALLKTTHEAINRSRVARNVKSGAGCDLLQRHRLFRSRKDLETGLQGTCSPQTRSRAFFKQGFDGCFFAAHKSGSI